MQEQTNVIHNAMQLTTAIALPMALKVAMDLGLLDIIEKAGPGARLSAPEIAARLVPRALDEEHASQMIDRILRLLSSYSVVTCSIADDHVLNGKKDAQVVQRFYGLAPLFPYFIHGEGHGASLASMFSMINDKLMTGVWYHMKDAILGGQVPFNKAYGMTASEYIRKDERFAPIFSKSMKDFNLMFMKKVLEVYNGFEGLKLIVDVGGGNGSILKEIISKYPNVKGINFDLPLVIEKSSAYPGIQNIAGDMHSNIPRGDAIFIKWVLRHLDDGQCLNVLKNCFEALPDGGKLMIVELVIPDIPDTSITNRSIFQFDLFLTTMINIRGKERTVGEFQALAKAAGFSGIQAAIPAYDITLLEFQKIATNNKELVF